MTNQQTNVANAAETTLNGDLAAGATTINVVDGASFPAIPFYITIDPGKDAVREVVLVDSAKTATTFTLSAPAMRGLDGTADVRHDGGAVVAVVPVAALWADINDRVDAGDTATTTVQGNLDTHAGAANPHSGSASNADLTAHTGATSAHSATSAATASRMMARDAAGRSKVAAPSAADDIARRDTVDGAVAAHAGGVDHVTNVSTATLPGSVPNGLTYVQPNAANNPEGTAGGIGLCTKSAGYVMQIFSHTNGNTYTRFGESTANTWQAWRRIDNL